MNLIEPYANSVFFAKKKYACRLTRRPMTTTVNGGVYGDAPSGLVGMQRVSFEVWAGQGCYYLLPLLDRSQLKGNKYGVITCTKCGTRNEDEARFCSKCNKKLQSSRQPYVPEEPSPAPLSRFTPQGLPPDQWRSFRRLLEAWVYLAVLIAVAGGCLYYETWWPLYPAVGVLVLLLRFRRI